MTARVIWRPEPLTARLVASARPAANDYSRLAAAKAVSGSKRVASSVSVGGGPTEYQVGSSSEIAPFIEYGTRPHVIDPGPGRVLAFADGGFATGPVNHPGMAATPFLRPLLPLWPSLYRRSAAGAFRGF